MRRLSKVEIKFLKKFYQKLADCRNLILSTKWFENHFHLSNDFFQDYLLKFEN